MVLFNRRFGAQMKTSAINFFLKVGKIGNKLDQVCYTHNHAKKIDFVLVDLILSNGFSVLSGKASHGNLKLFPSLFRLHSFYQRFTKFVSLLIKKYIYL